jgi:hypothetical protein
LWRDDVSCAALVQVGARAVDQLPAGRFGLADHPGHFGIVVVEHFAQQERRALAGSEAVEQRNERGGHVCGDLARFFRRTGMVVRRGIRNMSGRARFMSVDMER